MVSCKEHLCKVWRLSARFVPLGVRKISCASKSQKVDPDFCALCSAFQGITEVALNVNRQILFARGPCFRHARPFSASKRADPYFPGTRLDSTSFADSSCQNTRSEKFSFRGEGELL